MVVEPVFTRENRLGFKLNKISDSLWRLVHRSRIEESLLVFGVGRSGTTLLMELLYSLPGYRIVFEPFHPLWGADEVLAGSPELFPYHDLYRRLNEDDPRLQRYVEKLLRGQVSLASPTGARTKYEVVVRIIKKMFANKVLMKCIRANKIVHWIARRFSAKGIYLIIRNPGATIASQIKMGWFPKTTEHVRVLRNSLVRLVNRIVELEDKRDSLTRFISSLESAEEVMAAWWALDYSVPLYYRGKGIYHLVYYEHLVQDPEGEIKKIFNYIGTDVPPRAFEVINKPTSTSSSRQISVEEQLKKWRRVLDKEKAKKVFYVIERFGLNIYQYESDLPLQ